MTGLLAGLAGVITFGVMINTSVGVISRYFFNRPIGWTSEFNAYALLYITYLSAAWLLSKEGHVVINVLTQSLKPKPAAVLKVIASALSSLVYFVVAYFGVKVTWQAFVRNQPVVATVLIPKYTILIVIPIGCFFLAVQFIRRARSAFSELKKQDGSANGEDKVVV
jgi:TRAP-type C4-dicarboxylate transport system permease small subunit